MARIRSIKPEFWTSEQVMECQPLARLLFIGLWNFCDDAGNHPDAEKTIKALIFPGDDIDSLTVRRLLDELSAHGLLSFYEHEGKRYLHVSGWKHQKIDKPTVKYPPFSETPAIPDEVTGVTGHVVDEDSPSGSRGLTPGRGEDRERKGKGKGKSKSSTPPKGVGTTVSAELMAESVPGLSLDVASDYLAHRKAKRAPLTPRAWKGIANTLAQAGQLGVTPDAAMAKAIERGWTGLEIEWLRNAGMISGAPPAGRPGSLLTDLPHHAAEDYEDNANVKF
ncbi:DnaT-like ssDNA-binding domain-containing protein [Ectopseudomonas khazarica]|uniref:DnaT-like ssDNA-binding domain-containing protein n=1 Tax=Ectopseudomonas khazarica TaxID=2502979 RepID=UPI004034DDDE